ncbi:gluconokinase, GntK/IdnK-type [Streptomyces sp. NBC_01353]|uniref:gluconokinase, GntK/IdnK-type n=1 Tax=Streptomyces sp. NBC_01353 TaxID=2903835 RepID=UPI002E2F378E|nr:gluconokinase, GntK/IdnK-type [Streptomyces sp. NBC_01353]
MTLPDVVLVVGVSGSGKTTVARLLADRLGRPFRDADEFHSAANRAKMAAGHALTDSDRAPWLEAIGEWMDREIAARRPAVVTCSALTRDYRDRLLAGRPGVCLVYLHGSRDLLRSRLAARHSHFFPAELLDSQLADLQEPEPDEHPLVVEIDQTPESIVAAVLSLMRREPASGGLPSGSVPERAVVHEEPSVTPSPTGTQWQLTRDGQSAVVAQLGGALRAYAVNGRALLDGFSAESAITGGRGQLLAPWPNRVGGGRYRFGGREHQLPLTEPEKNNAIHGLLRWTLWSLLARTDDAVRVGTTLCPQPGYPFLLEVSAEYRLGTEGLETAIFATNSGTGQAPYGVGQHPYLTVGTDLVDTALLTVPARYRLRTDDHGLPIGQEPVDDTAYDFRTERPIGDLRLDTAFTGLDRSPGGRAVVRLAHPSGLRGVDLWLGDGTRYVQVYTGDTLAEPERRRRGVAVEAMSCPPDAFRSGTDLTALEPGATHVLRWGLSPWGTP